MMWRYFVLFLRIVLVFITVAVKSFSCYLHGQICIILMYHWQLSLFVVTSHTRDNDSMCLQWLMVWESYILTLPWHLQLLHTAEHFQSRLTVAVKQDFSHNCNKIHHGCANDTCQMSGHCEKGQFDTMNTVCCWRPIIGHQTKKDSKRQRIQDPNPTRVCALDGPSTTSQ